MNTCLNLLLQLSVIIIIVSFSGSVSASDNLVINGSFESSVENWKTNNSNVTFNIVTDPVFERLYSANITNTSSGSYGIEHTVSGIAENTDYLISGRVKTIDTPPSKAFIRIAWYESADASGSQIKTEDSEIISEITDWKIVSYVPKSPALAHSAKIRLLVSSGTAYFDTITLELNNNPTSELQVTPTTGSQLPTTNPTPIEITPTPDSSIDHIYISEAMVYPESGQIEWVELYNDNNFNVALSDWYIDDIENAGSSPKKFTMNISAKNYEVLDISSAMFNNDTDKVRLLDSEELEKDAVTYSSSQRNYSHGRITFPNKELCFQNPSKKMSNTNCVEIITTGIINTISPTKKTAEPTLKKTPLPTSGSKKLLPTLQAKKPASLQSATIPMEQLDSENILGTATEILLEESSSHSLIHTLTILTFSYSILSIISIVTKVMLQQEISAQ